jgi:hypothetical protein
MQTLRRRPNSQPAGYNVTGNEAKQTKSFNKNLRYVQGIRTTIAALSTTPITISLNSPGKFLLGISLMPESGTISDIAACQVKFVVNNNNILLNAQAQNLCPNYVQGMIFFPTPQPLIGTDSITMDVTKNNASAIVIYINVFYVPR